MNKNTAGALLVAILAVAGFAWSAPAAVWACIVVCASAFIAEELRDGDALFLGTAAAIVSWLAIVVAAIALI